jgi:hypothetical protein
MKKIMQMALAVALAFAAVAGAHQPAQAGRGYGHGHHHGHGGGFAAGVAAGVIGLGVLSAYSHARGPACYSGPERCGWSDRHCFHNRYGDWVCRGGRYHCWRPTYCD